VRVALRLNCGAPQLVFGRTRREHHPGGEVVPKRDSNKGLSLRPEGNRPKRSLRCLACNEPVEQRLSFLGSLPCLACREANAPLDPRLVAEWQMEGANF